MAKMSRADAEDLKNKLRAFYLAGGTRQEARGKFGLEESQISGISSSLRLKWSLCVEDRRWREENIKAGYEPAPAKRERHSAQLKEALRSPFLTREEAQKAHLTAEEFESARYLQETLYK